MASSARRGTFAFDLSKPLKKGMLLKQGQLHKAFKHRFFVLYPGFLVYYDDMTKWKLDITRGETLGGRLGAVKLRDGSVSIARSAPKGCKFGLIVHAPDPSNKRITYLLNATSKQDRNEWIEAISKATPQSKNSPRAARKDVKQRTNPEPKQKKEELPHPTYTQRQTTANEAALLSSEDQNGTDKVISIDEEIEPSIDVRHDTANIAALIGSCEPKESVEENGEPVTSIDALLGPKLDADHSSEEGSSRSGSPMNETKEEGQEKPAGQVEDDREGEDDCQAPVETSESVQSSLNDKGNLEVVTSVSVSVVVAAVTNGTENGEQSPKSESSEGDSNGKTAEVQDNGIDKQLEANGSSEGVQSSEVMFTHEENSNPISVTVTNMEDSSDSTSSDGESPLLEVRGIPNENSLPPNGMGEQLYEEQDKAERISTQPAPSITIERVPTLEENRKPGAEVAKTEQNEGRKDSSGSDKSTEALAPSGERKRRTSTPFIEKTGFLYKMGGNRPTWKLRYFVLRPGIFSYYKKNNTNTKPLGVVKLKNLQIFFPGVGERKQSYQFTVHTESSWNKRSDWVMAGQSESETKEWIAAFKLAGMKVSPPGSDEETGVATSNGAVSTH